MVHNVGANIILDVKIDNPDDGALQVVADNRASCVE